MRFNITATGDALIMKNLHPDYLDNFYIIKDFINKCDVKITNLETNISDFQFFASSFCGGTWLNTTPEVLGDLIKYGFNYCSFANNHALDYSYDGMFSTLNELKKRNIAFSGAGADLFKAAESAIIKTKNGSVAIISITSTINDAARAGYSTSVIPGRPGVNTLRYDTCYYIPEKELEYLKNIAEKTYINGELILNQRYGYELSDREVFKFGRYSFRTGEYKKETKCNNADLNRTVCSIQSLKSKVDYVLVIIHSHEVLKDKFSEPDDFLIEFAHKCIDAGACAIIGGGTHQLKPIEIYKGYPIFYSLGNFIYQGKSIRFQPYDFYEKYNVPLNLTTEEALNVRSQGDKIGIHKDFYNYMSFLPKMEFSKGKLEKLTLLPIELGFEKAANLNGLPCYAKGELGKKIYEHIMFISNNYNVNMKYHNDFIEVVL